MHELFKIMFTCVLFLAELASDGLKGRVFEVSLADLQNDEQAFRKFRLISEDIQGKVVLTNFHGMTMTTDKLRSLVKKWQVSGIRSVHYYLSTHTHISHAYRHIPYSRKFLWGPIFVIFADKLLSAILDPRNKYDCTVYYIGHDHHVCENFEGCPSAKIGLHEDFPLYGSYDQTSIHILVYIHGHH